MDPLFTALNPDTFEFDWEELDDEGKIALVKKASHMSPAQGIFPVIPGILSSDSAIRSLARDGLVQILKNISNRLMYPDQKADYRAALKESSQVAAQLYRQITPDLPENDVEYLFTALLSFGDPGAFFAFKILLKDKVAFDILLPVIAEVPESLRLNFVDQYLHAEPDVRLRYAEMFKGILKGISDPGSVIGFYAGLFDQKRSVDPFLNHIDPALRDARTIMENELLSEIPHIFILGLKALVMMAGKVPSTVLIRALENQEIAKIRQAVYLIIKNGSMDQYPKLFEPVWQHFYRSCRSDRQEAISSFKALVVSGRLPLSDLMDRVKATCPGIMPDLLDEIADLSRISFFFIQDMALTPGKYRTDHFDINQALILGMIKKRPERVLKILSRIPQGQNSGITAFTEQIKTLLLKEAKGIKSQFGMASSPDGKPRYSPLTSVEKKRLKTLGTKMSGASVLNFQGRIIQDLNLSGQRLSGPVFYFNQTVIKCGDWSGISVSKAYFKNSIFQNVDLSHARFEGVNFDNALFRNVKARGAVFQDCSFKGARLFNCDFSHGDLTDALFIGACIAKTEFKETNLTYASFAHGQISAVSFVTASLDHADFSYVRATFVRFPVYAKIRTLEMDYNARRYQLSPNGLPELPNRIIAEINLLVCCEFVHYGKGKFLEQNKLSLLTAFDIFTPCRADLFLVIPLLIHENIELIGSNPIDELTPCGIVDFQPSHQALTILEPYSKQKNLRGRIDLSPAIEALYTMGSIGSLAQTSESDLDYWVCINGETIGDRLDLLKQKLGMLEILARELFDTSVTFFIVDIQKARRNDFGGVSQESSGSAQAWLLKEEFYRTMIHVAGKLPLWSVLPTNISRNYYNLIRDRVCRYTRSPRYIDLGDIHSIPVNEYFGAVMWQMFKWLKSPFKSVIKMALFEIYAATYGKSLLLCNQYKNEWMNAGGQLKFARNDSYLAVLNILLPYYRSRKDTRSMRIILTCFFLKLEIREQSQLEDTPFGIRKILLDKVLADWGWSQNKVLDLGQYRLRSYSRIRDLSASIETYMVSKFERLQKVFDHPSPKNRKISDSDRERLTRKVDIVYKKKFYKIRKLFLIAVNEGYFSNLHMKYYDQGALSGKWELFHRDEDVSMDDEEPVFRAGRIEQIGAWLIYNHLYQDDARIGLIPNSTGIGHNDIQNLYRAMFKFFAAELTPSSQIYDVTHSLPTVVSMFITINMNSRRPSSIVEEYCAVYLNSWGELFCMPSLPGKRFDNLVSAKKAILSSIGIKTFPVNMKVYFPRGRVA